MQDATSPNLVPPAPGAVLVLERWNSWVRVFDPAEGAARWIDLEATEFESISDEHAAGDE